jgi:hypothetical protein
MILIRCRERSVDHQIPRVERALYAMPALIRFSPKFADQNAAHLRRIDVIHVRLEDPLYQLFCDNEFFQCRLTARRNSRDRFTRARE